MVAFLSHKARNAFSFRPDHDRGRAVKRRVIDRHLSACVRPEDPDAALLQLIDCGCKVRHAPDGQMLERAGSRFGARRVQPCAAAFWDQNAVRAGDLGAADDRAEIVRIGDSIAQNKKRRLAALMCECRAMLSEKKLEKELGYES